MLKKVENIKLIDNHIIISIYNTYYNTYEKFELFIYMLDSIYINNKLLVNLKDITEEILNKEDIIIINYKSSFEIKYFIKNGLLHNENDYAKIVYNNKINFERDYYLYGNLVNERDFKYFKRKEKLIHIIKKAE